MSPENKQKLISYLASRGINFLSEGNPNKLLFSDEDGLSFYVVWGFDWDGDRWHCGMSHVDSLLRRMVND